MMNQKRGFNLSLKQKMLFPLLISVLIPFILTAPFIFRELAQLRQQFIHDKVMDKQGEIQRAIDRAARDALPRFWKPTRQADRFRESKSAGAGL
jgi:hypothetical protein